jgi:hypothetical protein
MSKLFSEYKIKDLVLKNRIVMPPMCMYSAAGDGLVADWHPIHYASRAIGGVGLIIVEATGICPEGRISGNDLGIWDDENQRISIHHLYYIDLDHTLPLGRLVVYEIQRRDPERPIGASPENHLGRVWKCA